uniref:Uncharacterized protein n=1 Tax=Anopheles coluzzii TaxID=1518534 RepID=A0A6E8VFU2_ANOCL
MSLVFRANCCNKCSNTCFGGNGVKEVAAEADWTRPRWVFSISSAYIFRSQTYPTGCIKELKQSHPLFCPPFHSSPMSILFWCTHTHTFDTKTVTFACAVKRGARCFSMSGRRRLDATATKQHKTTPLRNAQIATHFPPVRSIPTRASGLGRG